MSTVSSSGEAKGEKSLPTLLAEAEAKRDMLETQIKEEVKRADDEKRTKWIERWEKEAPDLYDKWMQANSAVGAYTAQLVQQSKAVEAPRTNGGTSGAVHIVMPPESLSVEERDLGPTSVKSPTKFGDMDAPPAPKYFAVSQRPLFLNRVNDDEVYRHVSQLSLHNMGSEAQVHHLATAFISENNNALKVVTRGPQGEVTASYLFKKLHRSVGPFKLAERCKPELFVSSKQRGKLCVGFAGEGKTFRLGIATLEATYYATLWMQDALFCPMEGKSNQSEENTDGRSHIFWKHPPCCFVILYSGIVGFYCSVEMVGKSFLTIPFSDPFFLGGKDHKEMAGSLPWTPYPEGEEKEHLQIGVNTTNWSKCDKLGARVIWSKAPVNNHFVKVIRADAYKAETWINMYNVYSRLEKKMDVEYPNSLSLPAKMWYGNLQACIRLPWVEGRNATDDEFSDPAIQEQICQAVLFLANTYCLQYTDLHVGNVVIRMVNGVKLAVLVDYDECAQHKSSEECINALLRDSEKWLRKLLEKAV